MGAPGRTNPWNHENTLKEMKKCYFVLFWILRSPISFEPLKQFVWILLHSTDDGWWNIQRTFPYQSPIHGKFACIMDRIMTNMRQKSLPLELTPYSQIERVSFRHCYNTSEERASSLSLICLVQWPLISFHWESLMRFLIVRWQHVHLLN